MNYNLNSKDIQYVMEVAAHKSVSKAAANLYITQPALSSYISKLEERISIPLFERVGKKFIPTYAAEQIVKYGQKIHAIEDELEYKLGEIANGHTDRIRVGCTSSGGFMLLPPVIKKFKQLYPDSIITIFEAVPNVLKEKLINGELDVVFASSSLKDDTVDYKVIKRNSFVIYAAQNSEIACSSVYDSRYKFPVVDIKDCCNQQLLINDSLPLLSEMIESTFEKLGYSHNPEKIMHTQSQNTSICLAGLDLGFCLSYENAHTGLDMPEEPQMFLIKGFEDTYMESVAFARKDGMGIQIIKDFVDCAYDENI